MQVNQYLRSSYNCLVFAIFEKTPVLKKILLLCLPVFFIQYAFCQKKYWQQQTDYTISVSLNDSAHSLSGMVQIDYFNHSPDTLFFIPFHLWPNAYKNDRTAFSDQLLEDGRTDFYFSEEDKRGYINGLSFKADNINAVTEDHPLHRDITRLILPVPLAPGGKVKIETPFYIKLPYNFSRGGHNLQSYQATQWYPKPAVYDKTGWHEMPYLDRGEFYSEFGDYKVSVTLPSAYILAATGTILQSTPPPASVPGYKTVTYTQTKVHDFAWFADKTFSLLTDTMQLPSGRVIAVNSYVLPANKELWKNSNTYIKDAVRSKSLWIGEYPYDIVSVVDNAAPASGGMEYPTITVLNAGGSAAGLESVINHEVGHNWFYGILATNERKFPWMDEGMNTFYDNRYAEEYGKGNKNLFTKNAFLGKRTPGHPEDNVLATLIKIKKDQPINTESEKFRLINYGLIAYRKAGRWMKELETDLGRENFDRMMKAYYEKWKFRHPYPEDFKAIAEEAAGMPLTERFRQLEEKGSLEKATKKQFKPVSFFSFKETERYHYISFAPAAGYNYYDRFMIGGLIHNYNLPPSSLQFIAVPLYATGSKKLNGIGRAEYNIYPGNRGSRLSFSLAGEKFTANTFTDAAGIKTALQFSKIVPGIKYVFRPHHPRSTVKKYIQWKTFLINEANLAFKTDPVTNNTVIIYPTDHRYVNRVRVGIENNRALYPYAGLLQADQGDGFFRIDFTGNYFFNYVKGGGLGLRFFAGKFVYTGDKSFNNQFRTDRYHFNLSGPKGNEDYTYSNYFAGRNEFEGFASQQIMNRDGFFKVRTDLLSNKIGKTDDWLGAVNLTSDIPHQINPFAVLPFKIPVKLFADIGTFAEAWKTDSPTGRFLYDAGVQVSLIHDVLNVYFPLVYSKVYRDYFKSTLTEKRFIKNISFSIDIEQLKVSKLFPSIHF